MPADVRKIPISLKSMRDLRSRYLAEAPFGGVVVEVDPAVRDEELVELDLSFGDSDERFNLRGLVLWCRQAEGNRRVAGVGFLASEADTRERMLRPMESENQRPPLGADATRREPRYDMTLEVGYETATESVVDRTQNISLGGLSIASPRPPAVGACLVFRLFPPRERSPIELPGQVTWRRPGRAFGVRFTELKEPVRARLGALVKQIASEPGHPAQLFA